MKPGVFLFPLLVCLFFACTIDEKRKKTSSLYIISKVDSIHLQRLESTGLPPQPFMYGDYNFVVDSQGKVYLHRKSSFGMFDYGPIDPIDPPKIGLDASDFRAIGQNDLQDFLTRLASSWNQRDVLVIASAADTVKGGLIYPLIDTLKAGRAIQIWQIRRMTKEEGTTLKRKVSRL